jgi:hypothetical protein
MCDFLMKVNCNPGYYEQPSSCVQGMKRLHNTEHKQYLDVVVRFEHFMIHDCNVCILYSPLIQNLVNVTI